MAIGTLFIFFVFLAFSIILLSGKGAFLIAGYNTLPEDERAKYNEQAFCKFMGKVMLGISISVLLISLSDFLYSNFLLAIGAVGLIGLVIFTLIYTNTKNRFKNF